MSRLDDLERAVAAAVKMGDIIIADQKQLRAAMTEQLNEGKPLWCDMDSAWDEMEARLRAALEFQPGKS